jgi:hypothetical protein
MMHCDTAGICEVTVETLLEQDGASAVLRSWQVWMTRKNTAGKRLVPRVARDDSGSLPRPCEKALPEIDL